jgi:hypothetical protein
MDANGALIARAFTCNGGADDILLITQRKLILVTCRSTRRGSVSDCETERSGWQEPAAGVGLDCRANDPTSTLTDRFNITLPAERDVRGRCSRPM